MTTNTNTTTAKEEEAAAAAASLESLPRLLAALASGAKAVANLPLQDEYEYQSSFPEFSDLHIASCETLVLVLKDTGILDHRPSSTTATTGSTGTASTATNTTRRSSSSRKSSRHVGGCMGDVVDVDDPWLWETCADACDAWMEQVDAHLCNHRNKHNPTNHHSIQQLSEVSRQKHKGTYQNMLNSIVDMEKPQLLYSIPTSTLNDRHLPFVPNVHVDKPFHVDPLPSVLNDLLQEGHGLESRFGDSTIRGGRSVVTIVPPDVIAPTHHAPHLYETEIKSFSYTSDQLRAPSNKPSKLTTTTTATTTAAAASNNNNTNQHDPSSLSATWIDTKEQLADLARLLEHQTEVAVDLEAHSHRSFAGMVCLMQLSFVDSNTGNNDDDSTSVVQDYLIDTLALWHDMNDCLASFFANPSILKIMHGADSDVQWLQRDFGIYVVNLFDTGKAARALQLTSAGLAHLLFKYQDLVADKKHQLSDWRQRPLSSEMKLYATMDTHYLLNIYHQLQWELEHHNHQEADVSIASVLDTSRQVSLIRYDKEPFKPSGYQTLLRGRARTHKHSSKKKVQHDLTSHQEDILKQLYDWRDQAARDHDESIAYVCTNSALLRLAMVGPKTVTALQGCLNPMPPMVMKCSFRVLECIKRSSGSATAVAGNQPTSTTGSPIALPSAALVSFKPVTSQDLSIEDDKDDDNDVDVDVDDRHSRRGILSPVLGTEEMYQQAGWMTQSRAAVEQEDRRTIATTTDEEDLDATSQKPKHLLMVNPANKDYRSKQFTAHSLEMGTSNNNGDSTATPAATSIRTTNDNGDAILTTTTKSPNTARSNKDIATSVTARSMLGEPATKVRTANGLGAAQAAREHRMHDPTDPHLKHLPSSLEEETERAHLTTQTIRSDMLAHATPDLLGLTSHLQDDDDDDEADDDDDDEVLGDGDKGADGDNNSDDSDFEIPQSMRDIYKISNKNRRRNKKLLSPPQQQTSTPQQQLQEQGQQAAEHMEVDTLEGAEAILASRGLDKNGYFGAGDANVKRQRTKMDVGADDPTTTTVTAAATINPTTVASSRDEDVAFMQDVGWMKNKQEVDDMMIHTSKEELEPLVQQQEQQALVQTSNKAFDYSSIGAGIGVYYPNTNGQVAVNPFFAGAAVAGGEQQQRKKQSSATTGNSIKSKSQSTTSSTSNQVVNIHERPDKKDGRTFVYKKK